MIINGKSTPATQFAYDGCHKIYLLEADGDEQEATMTGYAIRPIGELPDVYRESCMLRFISNWQLTEQYAEQCEVAEFTEGG